MEKIHEMIQGNKPPGKERQTDRQRQRERTSTKEQNKKIQDIHSVSLAILAQIAQLYIDSSALLSGLPPHGFACLPVSLCWSLLVCVPSWFSHRLNAGND